MPTAEVISSLNKAQIYNFLPARAAPASNKQVTNGIKN